MPFCLLNYCTIARLIRNNFDIFYTCVFGRSSNSYFYSMIVSLFASFKNYYFERTNGNFELLFTRPMEGWEHLVPLSPWFERNLEAGLGFSLHFKAHIEIARYFLRWRWAFLFTHSKHRLSNGVAFRMNLKEPPRTKLSIPRAGISLGPFMCGGGEGGS